MKELALAGTTGPVYANVLSALLHAGRDVDAMVTDPERLMLDTTNITVQQFRTDSKADMITEFTGFSIVILAYETDFRDVNDNAFILGTYSETVNAAIEAGVKRLIVVGNKDSEAFFCGELSRHKGLIESTFISTEGDYATAVVREL